MYVLNFNIKHLSIGKLTFLVPAYFTVCVGLNYMFTLVFILLGFYRGDSLLDRASYREQKIREKVLIFLCIIFTNIIFFYMNFIQK